MIRLLLLAWSTFFFVVPAARGAETDVSPALLCQVQTAIRRAPAWPAEKCDRVAAALNVTTAPGTFLAIAILESDLRDRAIAWHGPRVADVGLTGLRCLVGDHGRCTNGVVAGYTVAELKDPVVNLAVADRLLASLGGRVGRWNAGSRGYAARVRAIAAALEGRRVQVQGARVRELVRRILAVTEPRS